VQVPGELAAIYPNPFVILSDARRSVATERESKDLCTLAFPTKHQGILTVHSFIELFAVCKCYGILTVHSVIKLFAVCKCYRIFTVHFVIKLFPCASARELAAAYPIYLSS
jgi:hypothetical protein